MATRPPSNRPLPNKIFPVLIVILAVYFGYKGIAASRLGGPETVEPTPFSFADQPGIDQFDIESRMQLVADNYADTYVGVYAQNLKNGETLSLNGDIPFNLAGLETSFSPIGSEIATSEELFAAVRPYVDELPPLNKDNAVTPAQLPDSVALHGLAVQNAPYVHEILLVRERQKNYLLVVMTKHSKNETATPVRLVEEMVAIIDKAI